MPTEPISPLSTTAEPLREQVVQQPRREINITFQGSGRYTQEEIREALFPALNEALGDGLVLNVH